MRFEVPQFIEVEDKIFGPFTWKQFIYLAGGAGACVVLYLTVPFFFFIIFGLPLVALTGFLSFHRVNNRPFSIFLESFVQYLTHNKLYLWKRRNQQSVLEENNAPEAPLPYTPPTSKSTISTLSRRLELNTLEK